MICNCLRNTHFTSQTYLIKNPGEVETSTLRLWVSKSKFDTSSVRTFYGYFDSLFTMRSVPFREFDKREKVTPSDCLLLVLRVVHLSHPKRDRTKPEICKYIYLMSSKSLRLPMTIINLWIFLKFRNR